MVLRMLPTLLLAALWIYAFLDCLATPRPAVRNLPKPVWLVLVALLGPLVIGPVAWLVAGRPRTLPRANVPLPAGPPSAAPRRVLAPDDDPEFLASLAEQLRERRRREQDGGA